MSKKIYMRLAIGDLFIPNKEGIEITSVVATDNFGNTYEPSAYFLWYEDENGEEIFDE